MTTFKITHPTEITTLQLNGKKARTPNNLIKHGEDGITAFEMSGWAYIFELRSKYGLDIETVYEGHSSPDGKGAHARYILRTDVDFSKTEGLSNGM